jgi:glycerophosphoryl diester phosphodiesterase
MGTGRRIANALARTSFASARLRWQAFARSTFQRPSADLPATSSLLPPIVGHRGSAASAPENTLASLRLAAAQGARMVEFDAKLTADGVVILMHDDNLGRTTSALGPVAATDWAEIAKLDAGSWFGPAWRGEPVPTLEQALALLVERDLMANIEIKSCPGRETETALAVIETIASHWPKGRGGLVLSSFSRASLAAARDGAPGVPRGLLIWEKPADWPAAASALGCRSIHCAARFLTPEWAAEIKRLGYDLMVYTVNDPALARQLLGWGVDSIVTDSPGALDAALRG